MFQSNSANPQSLLRTPVMITSALPEDPLAYIYE